MKQTIRLTESDIRRMVMEAMNELDWKTYANAADKRGKQAYKTTNNDFLDYMDKEVRSNKLKYAATDSYNKENPNGEQIDNICTGRDLGVGLKDDQRIFMNSDDGTGRYLTYKGITICLENNNMFVLYDNPKTHVVKRYNVPDLESARKFIDDIVDNGAPRDDYWKTWQINEAITRAIRKYLK